MWLRNLKKKERGIAGRGLFTDATTDRLQNYADVAVCQNVGDLQNMESSFLASLFHVPSNKGNMYHYPHCPTGPDSWCKYKADKANNN